MIRETARRRKLQALYNKEHNINPKTVYKTFEEIMSSTIVADSKAKNQEYGKKRNETRRTSLSILTEPVQNKLNSNERKDFINQLRKQMIEAAKDLEFERAAEIRDEISRLEN